MMPDYAHRFQQLDLWLHEFGWLWRPQPYKIARPDWCDQLPQLTQALLQLTDAELSHYASDHAALLAWLNRFVPGFDVLIELTELSAYEIKPLRPLHPSLQWDIPGRKWHQIEAFVGAIDNVTAPLLEWCGGKGHLGRLLAHQFRVPVLTLEYDEELCAAGERLSRRGSLEQQFHVLDVLSPLAGDYLPERHVVALHACGELHRTAVRGAVTTKTKALDFVPCCYHLGVDENYQPFTLTAQLQLTTDDVRLAVTETVTLKPREQRKRDQEMAWKLGFELLRQDVTGDDCYRPLKSIDKSWLAFDYDEFCRRLAARECIGLNESSDWSYYEAQGWQRQREVMRLSLPRQSVRRALELWLVLDMVNYLCEQGYNVRLGSFCQREVTPRNILVSARFQ